MNEVNEKLDDTIYKLGAKKYLTKVDRSFLVDRLLTLKSTLLKEEFINIPRIYLKNKRMLKRIVLKRVRRKIKKEVGRIITTADMRPGDTIEVNYSLKINDEINFNLKVKEEK